MPEVRYGLDRSRRVATLTLDSSGPLNTIGARLVADLERAWRRAAADGAAAVLLRSAKKRSFLDGANLAELLKMGSPDDLRALLERFQGVMAEMAASPTPLLGVVEGGSALGGGFELLLWACDGVLATPGSRLGLPEVNVGLFPAGGGTHTLRRWLGLEASLDVMAAGRVLPAEQLSGCGLVTVVPPGELESAIGRWVADHPVSRNRSLEADPAGPEAAAVIAGFRRRHQVSSCKPWFAALFDSVEEGLGLGVAEASLPDVERFVALFGQPTSRNAVDFFFLSTSLGPRVARVREEAARPVERIAVLGAGLMGRGIAQVAADSGLQVLLLDVGEAALEAAVADLRSTLDGLVAKGRWTQARRDALLSRLATSTDYGRLAGIPLVVEAVFEELELKQRVLAQVQAVAPDSIFASNTSTIPMARIAARSERPEQVVGMHFFSPVPLMSLLEVVEGAQSSEAAVATAVLLGRRLGKTCILVGDGPGFYTSRCFGVFVLTGLTLAELGMAPQEVDRIAVDAGFPQGPLHVYGSVGGSVVYHAGRFMAANQPHHEVPASLESLFRAGYTGAGRPCFYLDARGLQPDPSALVHVVRRPGPTPTAEEARDLLLLGMVNEAFRCREEGVVRDLASMDLGAVLGIGFPQCWHGPARYLSLRGVRACRDRLAELHARFGVRQLAPCRELDRLLACGVDGGLI
jgi:3-hydroxyacyl-CoA dehydrogenase/enoyl-CoA hydratase/3-hydroxybutyryl-CoA epimerase